MALPQVFDASMADGATLTSGIDLGGVYEDIYLKVPVRASAANIYIHGSVDNSTFFRIAHPPINSATVAINDFVIQSATTSRMVPIPNGFRYLKVEISTLASADVGFEIIAQRKL